MRKNMLFGGILCAFLLAAAPAQAVIIAVLETPAEGGVSGINQIRGHARTDANAAVTVRLRVNGETRQGDDGVIPCCSARADVTTAVNSGYNAQINYGVFPAGPLSIGVEITAAGEETVTIDRSVQVVKLGGEEFADNVDLSAAAVSIDVDGNIVITGVDVNPLDNLILSYLAGINAFGVIGGDFQTSVYFDTNLTLDQSIPASVGAEGAWGEGFFILNEDNSLDYVIVASNLTGAPIAAHFHMGAAGVAGDVVIDLGAPVEDPTGTFVYTGSTDPLSDTLLAYLQSGRLYINVHTEANPAGEIRGQIGAALQNANCSDTRVFHPTPMPSASGTMTPTPNQGCRLMPEKFCPLAWQNPGGAPEFGEVSCAYFGEFSACGANGPFVGGTNTCAP